MEYILYVYGPSVPYQDGRHPLIGEDFECYQIYESVREPTVNGKFIEPYYYLSKVRVSPEVAKAIMADSRYEVFRDEPIEQEVDEEEKDYIDFRTDTMMSLKGAFIDPGRAIDVEKEALYQRLSDDNATNLKRIAELESELKTAQDTIQTYIDYGVQTW